MICPNCKAIIDDNSKFCTVCGSRLTQQAAPAPIYNAPQQNFSPNEQFGVPSRSAPNYTLNEQDARTVTLPQNLQNGVPSNAMPGRFGAPNPEYYAPDLPKQKKNGGVKIAAVAVIVIVFALCIAAVFLLTVQAKPFVSDYDNGKIFTGCDGYGSVTDDGNAVFDTFEFYKSLGGETFGTENEEAFLNLDINNVRKNYSYSTLEIENIFDSYNKLKSAVKIKFSSDKSIKNNDAEKFDISIDTKKINSLGFKKKLIGKKEFETEITVSSLPTAVDIDPFEFLKGAVYDKTTGEIYCVYNKQLIKTIGDYTVSFENESLAVKNKSSAVVGTFAFAPDTSASAQKPSDVVIKLSCNNDEFAKYGILFKNKDKKVTVGDCDYTSDITKINASDLEKLENFALQTVSAYHSDAKEEKIYFSYKGEGYTNKLIFTYSYTDLATNKVLYATVAFDNIKSDSNKNLATNSDNATPSVTDSMASLKDIEKEYKPSSEAFYSVIIQKK